MRALQLYLPSPPTAAVRPTWALILKQVEPHTIKPSCSSTPVTALLLRSLAAAVMTGGGRFAADRPDEQEDEESFLEWVTGERLPRAGHLGRVKVRKLGTSTWSDACSLEPGTHPLGEPAA